MGMSLWRGLLYEELSKVILDGKIIDLGGSRKSKYHELIGGEHEITVANLDDEQGNDLHFDLEQPFPIKEASYDAILCINVLEHIFDYTSVLKESHRILNRDGVMILAVPFLIRVHPSPHDYWRYTDETLQRIFHNAGFSDVHIKPIGTGVFGASYSLRHNLYRVGVVQSVLKTFAKLADKIVGNIKGGGTFTKNNYPLGYMVTAKK